MEASSWTPQDYALLLAALGATHEDVQSTKDAAKHKRGHETNPIYGTPNPTGAALDQGELSADALGSLAAHYAGREWRAPVLAGWTGMEGTLAALNRRKGGGVGKDLTEPLINGAALAALAYAADKYGGSVGPGIVQGVPTLSYSKQFSEGGTVKKN